MYNRNLYNIIIWVNLKISECFKKKYLTVYRNYGNIYLVQENSKTKERAKMKEIFLVLCEGRHEMPTNDGCIFAAINNVTDTEALEAEALKRLSVLARDVEKINIYVTGLTVALIASLNACTALNKAVVLWYFDRDNNSYFLQEAK